jgi:hypothetical protein
MLVTLLLGHRRLLGRPLLYLSLSSRATDGDGSTTAASMTHASMETLDASAAGTNAALARGSALTRGEHFGTGARRDDVGPPRL